MGRAGCAPGPVSAAVRRSRSPAAKPAKVNAPPSTSVSSSVQGRHELLRNRADWRPVLWIVTYFLLSAIAWHCDPVVAASLPLAAAAVVVLCYFSFAGATIVHNTMHIRCFKNRTLETIWHHALSMTYGHPVSTFVPGHNLSHHRYSRPTKRRPHPPNPTRCHPDMCAATSLAKYSWRIAQIHPDREGPNADIEAAV